MKFIFYASGVHDTFGRRSRRRREYTFTGKYLRLALDWAHALESDALIFI